MISDLAQQLLENAIKRRNELTQEAMRLDTLIAFYQGLLTRGSGESQDGLDQLQLSMGPSRRAVHAAQIAEMLEVARRIIIKEKRPMKRGELVRRLSEQGFEIVGKNKNKVFGTNIWRSGKFRTIAGKGYWPKDVALTKS